MFVLNHRQDLGVFLKKYWPRQFYTHCVRKLGSAVSVGLKMNHYDT